MEIGVGIFWERVTFLDRDWSRGNVAIANRPRVQIRNGVDATGIGLSITLSYQSQ
jgi:hypothetical protein